MASSYSGTRERQQNSLLGFLDPLRREPTGISTALRNQTDNNEEYELEEFDVPPPPPDSSQAVLSAPRTGAGFGAQIFPGPTVLGCTHLLSTVLADVVKPEIKSRIYIAVSFRAESGNMMSLFRSMQYINNHYSARAAGGSSTASATSLITGFMLVGDEVCCIMLEGDPWLYIDMLSVLNKKIAHYSLNPNGFIVDARVIRVQHDIRDAFLKKLIYETLPPPTNASDSVDPKLLQDEVRLGLLFFRRLTDLGRYCSVGIEETWADLFQNLSRKYPHFYVSPEIVQNLALNPKFMTVSQYLQMYVSKTFPHSSPVASEGCDKLSGINDLLKARKWSIPIAGLHFGDSGQTATPNKAAAAVPTIAAAAVTGGAK